MKENKINFQVNNQKVVGILTEPEKKTKNAILLLHGFKGTRDEWGRFKKLAEALSKEGFANLRIDMRGSGESEGRFRDMTIFTEKEDAVAAIDYLTKQGYEKIGLMGLSLGGLVSLLTSLEIEISAMCLWAPAIYYRAEKHLRGKEKELEERGYVVVFNRVSGEPFEVEKKFFETLNEINTDDVLENVKCPTLIIHGNRDESIPIEGSKKAVKSMNCEKELKIIPDADHDFYEQIDEVIGLTVEWFKDRIRQIFVLRRREFKT